MGGWNCKDNELIEWDGTIKSTHGFQGDGSRLTGIAGGTGINLWTSGAEHIYPITGTQIISGAGFTTAGVVSGANITILTTSGAQIVIDFKSLSGAYYAYLPIDNQTSAGLVALSSAYYAHIPMYNITSGSLVALSSAFNTTFMPMYQQTSGALNSLSNAYVAHLIQNNVTSGGLVVVSAAYYAHAADASNPHTVNLTQTYLALTSGAVSGDIANSGAMYIPNLVFNTTSAGVTASNYPIGSLLVVYS